MGNPCAGHKGLGGMERVLEVLGDESVKARAEPRHASRPRADWERVVWRGGLDQMFLDQARLRPDATALTFEGRQFTYGWLETASRRLAGHLFATGVRQGALVGVHMTRSAEMVAALLAVLRAGAAYLPLDPAFPQARLALIIEDAGPVAVLSDTSLDGRLDGGPSSRLLVDALLDVEPPKAELPPCGADDLAYVLYTSGSTGRPKGVEITHGAVINLLRSFEHDIGFTSADRMLASTTIAFDISVLELFLPLVAGGEIVLAGSEAAKDPQALAALLEQTDCSFGQATPSKWRFMIEAGWKGKAGLAVLCGGEALDRKLADLLLARCETLWNVYGPTETTVWSSLAAVEPGSGAPSIGWAIRNTQLHVLDEAGRPVAGEAVGELYIGGKGLARGYRGRPELTRERFVLREGERLYRTGDLVRRRSDGALDCLGRTDHQVKVRGYRIELGEVEAALLACPDVAQAAVTTAGAAGEERLIGYVSLRAGARLDSVQLRQALARGLPDYMIPAAFTVMDALPMTPNGKIDRNALPPPPAPPRSEAPRAADDGVQTSIQARLAEIWCETLGVAEVRPEDNFFDLGGYSLLILKLLRRIEASFGRSLTMADLFAAADLKTMAEHLGAPPADGRSSNAIPLQPLGERPPLIWFDVGPQLRGLARVLAPHQPFVGLNLEAADARALAGGAIDAAAVAGELVRLLRRHQPRGPYYLGGWCRWGVMAFAAASQLEQEGEEVRLLVMLDSVNATSPYQVLKRTTRSALHAVSRRKQGLPPPLALTTDVEAAALRYRPGSYGGDVLLLCSRDGEPDLDGSSGWRSVVHGALEVYRAGGDHASILEPPCVEALGEVLLTSLARAQRRTARHALPVAGGGRVVKASAGGRV